MRANPPIAVLSQLDLNAPEGKRALIEILNQLWLKTGGGDDFIAGVASASSTNFYAGSLVEDQPAHAIFPHPEEETLIGETSSLGVNSTVTPLSGSATFTGTAEQNDWPDVGVSCYSSSGTNP